MIFNDGAAQGTARVIYPELPDPLTSKDLHRLFSPSFDERKWAPTVARTPASQVGLLVQLKVFQTIGRFRRVSDIPAIVFLTSLYLLHRTPPTSVYSLRGA